MLLPIHIAAGGLAIVLGAVALSVKKGGTIHRRSGLMFVYAMLVMGASASILGLRNGLTDGNVMGGLMTAYFVGTALTTVRPASPWTRRINAAALTFALGLALVAIMRGVKAVNTPRVSPGGVPFRTIGVMSFVLATSCSWRRSATCASCDSARLATDRAWRAICGACASPSSSRPARSSRSVSASRKSFRSH